MDDGKHYNVTVWHNRNSSEWKDVEGFERLDNRTIAFTVKKGRERKKVIVCGGLTFVKEI